MKFWPSTFRKNDLKSKKVFFFEKIPLQCNVKVWDDKKSCIFFEKFYYIARLDNTFHTLVIWGQIRLYSSNPFSAIRYENPLCTKSHSETCYKRDLVATSSTNLYVFLPRKHN